MHLRLFYAIKIYPTYLLNSTKTRGHLYKLFYSIFPPMHANSFQQPCH